MKNIFTILGVIGLLIIAFVAGMYIMNQNHENANLYKSPQQAKAELKQQEFRNPPQHLEIDATLKEIKSRGTLLRRSQVIGNELVGTIKNSAAVATFKDAVINVTYYSKTKTEVGSETFIVYEKFPPGSSVEVRLELDLPDATRTYFAIVTDAAPVYLDQ